MAIWKLILICVALLLVWVTLSLFGAFRGWWMSPVVGQNDLNAFYDYAVGVLEERNKGASALVLINDGQIAKEYYASPSQSVNAQTVFAAASMSKWIAAYAMMTLVEVGRADLDAPVSQYLTRWQLPESPFDNGAVTIRRLLSHTAGLDDNLGFGEYALDEKLPSLETELKNPRASSGRDVSMAVATQPGDEWQYSGGGYLLIELLIEELTNKTYEDYVREAVFEPLDMMHAGYDALDSYRNNAGLYSRDGRWVPSSQYASSAATGLIISSDDLAKFLIAQTHDNNATRPLSAEAIRAMREPHGRTAGANIWGLGTILYAPSQRGDFVFGHDGANEPAVNTIARVNPDNGDAVIALVSGHPSIATGIGSEWVLWQTGRPDVLAIEAVLSSVLIPMTVGGLLIVAMFAVIGFRRRHLVDS